MSNSIGDNLRVTVDGHPYHLLKEFHLSLDRRVEIVYDTSYKIFALLTENQMTTKLTADQLIGLPQTLSPLNSKQFLEASHVSVSRNNKCSPYCRFYIKGRGGGEGVSHPVNAYIIRYGPGPTIRKLEMNFAMQSLFGLPPISRPTQEGGCGTKTLKIFVRQTNIRVGRTVINFLNSHAAILSAGARLKWTEENTWSAKPPLRRGYPRVRIHVWKKDYYEVEIQNLVKSLNADNIKERDLNAEKGRLEKAITTRPSLSANLMQDQQKLQQTQRDLAGIHSKIADLDQKIEKNQADLSHIEQQRRERYGQIEALAQLIELVDQLKITALQNPHASLAQFRERALKAHRAASLTVPISDEILGRAVRALKPLVVESGAASGKIVVVVMGTTGAGKSTIINHLLGVQLTKDPATGQVKAAPNQVELTKIGHNAAQSETFKTAIYERVGIPFTFADCGGFLDTRGLDTELAVVTSLKLTIEKAASAKILLCFDTRALEPLRGQHFRRVLETVLKGFLNNYPDFMRSFALLFNRTIKDPDGVPYTVEDLRQIIAEYESEARAAKDRIAELYAFVLREGGKHIYLYDPLSPSSRERIHHSLAHEIIPVAPAPHRFSIPYTPELQATFVNEMIRVAALAHEIYSQKAQLQTQFEQLSSQKALENLNLQQINQQIKTLTEKVRVNNAELSKIPEAVFYKRLNEINTELQNIAKNKTTWNQRLSLINTEGFITYHSGGNSWRVADGGVTLEPNKIF